MKVILIIIAVVAFFLLTNIITMLILSRKQKKNMISRQILNSFEIKEEGTNLHEFVEFIKRNKTAKYKINGGNKYE